MSTDRVTRERWVVRVGSALIVFALGVTAGAALEAVDPGPREVPMHRVDPTETGP